MDTANAGQTTKLFGIGLEATVKAQQAKGSKKEIPLVIHEIISWLYSHNLQKDIFDTLGDSEAVQQIKEKMDGGDVSLSSYGDDEQHNVLAVLKLYLREMPEPIPSRFYSTFLLLLENPDTSQKAYVLRVLVYLLPKPSRELLLYLLGFMYTVSQKEDIGSEVLASVFGPYMFRPDASSTQIVDDVPLILSLTQFLIDEAPFMLKTTNKPVTSPLNTPPPVDPSYYSLQAKALYPYAGGSKWLLAFEKEKVLSLLDIKSEDGWLKGDLEGKIGYLPTTYVAPILLPLPSADLVRVSIPSEVATEEEVASLVNETALPPIFELPPPPTIDIIPLPPIPDDIPPISILPPPPVELPPPIEISEPLKPVVRRHQSKTISMYMGVVPPLPTFTTTSGSPSGSPFSSPYISPSVSAHLDVDGGTINQMTTGIVSSGDKRRNAQYATLRNPVKSGSSSSAPLFTKFREPTNIPPPIPEDGDPYVVDESAVEAVRVESTEVTMSNTDPAGTASVITALVPPPPPLPVEDLSSAPPIVDEAKEAQILVKRRERAEEVLTTERTYVKQLTAVYDLFLEPLKRREREKHPIISSTEIYDIFSNIEVILNCHRKLLDALEQRMQVWDSKPELGDIFLENTAFIKLYKYYVNNFDKSIITLKSCREKSPEFKKFVVDLDYTEKLSGLNLEAFVILPVQRIPRYVLLLTDLLRYTSTQHSDFNNLSNALAFIKDLADYINTNKSDADNINRILALQDGIIDLPTDQTLVAPRRRFIEECPMLANKKKVHLYLFSDALLVTKPEKKGKRYKTLINLQTASLNTTDEHGVLKIISTDGTYKLSTENAKDREHWSKILKETINSSRTDMLTSAFGANMQNEGSKKFMKIQDEENAQKRHAVSVRTLQSEEEYVQSLTYIRNTFFAPLRKSVDSSMPMISLSDIIDITSNLETLLSCHIAFISSVRERLNEWDEKPLISDLFTEKATFLKLYNYYVANHHKSLETIDKCIEKSPLFAIFLRDLEAREKVELKMLLQQPLRRVSAYYLLMQEMLQFTRPKTDDFDALSKVVAKLKEQTEQLDADIHKQANKKLSVPDKKDRRKSSSKFRLSSTN